MGNELAGKVAVVTGGAAGLGAAIVERFLGEGAIVVFGDIDAEQGQALAARHGGEKALFLPTDVAVTEQLTRLIDTAVEKFGGLDVMVNNAGVSGRMHRSFLDDGLEDFEQVMAVNVKAVMAGTRDAARHMTERGGSIVNLTSIGGIQAGGGVMTYRASKAAVIHFTKCAAIELANHEIRVNCLAPGHIRTAIVSKSAHGMDPEQVAKFEAGIRATMRADRPLEREGTAEDVAEAILYFAGDRSPYVTGTVLPVDGGTAAGKPVPKKKKRPADS